MGCVSRAHLKQKLLVRTFLEGFITSGALKASYLIRYIDLCYLFESDNQERAVFRAGK